MDKRYFILTISLAFMLVLSTFFKIFQHPSEFLFSTNGDGLKNYYTVAYYVDHGAGLHFSGMNYPYGEHVAFTDNQPVVSMVLRWYHQHIHPIESVTGVINLWMLLSIVLGAAILFLILRHFGIGKWFSVIGALCIAFMSPQLFRLESHYSLSYIFYFPLVWYLLLKIYDNQRKVIWTCLLLVFLIISGLTHLYFYALSSLFIFVFLIFGFLDALIKRHSLIPYAKISLAFVIASMVILYIIKGVDPITDRPVAPWGIDYYTANLFSTFLPQYGLMRPLPEFLEISLKWEGLSYVGLVGVLLLPMILFRVVRKLIKGKFGLEKFATSNPLIHFVAIRIACLGIFYWFLF